MHLGPALRRSAAGEGVRSSPMKKLVILAVILILGAVAAKRLRST